MITIDFLYGFLAGVGLAALPWILPTILRLLQKDRDVYNLQHWKLNVQLPPETMWMNLGYWHTVGKSSPQVFRDACAALLHEVLYTSGIIERPGAVNSKSPASIAILDLGFGCGDQTLEIARLAQDGLVDGLSYVGLTLNAAQSKSASDKLTSRISALGSESVVEEDHVQLYCADAADPQSWSPSVQQAVEALGSNKDSEKWLLALDCLVHFSPSRRPIFKFVGSKQSPFHANIMAFDLLLSDKATSSQTMAIKLIGKLMRCPSNAFLTEDCYRQQLVEAGYPEDKIIIRDVTDNVFPGLVAFLQRQDVLLRQYGISLGKLSIAKKVFEWFSSSRVLKAAIIVARKDS